MKILKSCTGPYYDLGCKGGDFEGGMKYIIDHGGISLEAEYPYLAEDSKCNHKKEGHKVNLAFNQARRTERKAQGILP